MSETSRNEDTSHETIRKVVKEGLEARNLLNFISDGSVEDIGTSKKPPRPQSVSPKPLVMDSNKGIDTRILIRSSKRRGALSRPKSRWRSASAGRNPEKDLRARYWTFLFENLHRAVDEIYQTCEMDESIVESKEAIMMLENYSKEFHALIQYININKDYEKTAPPNRPTSLAWEVRKSSPGKSLLKNVFIEKLTTGNSNAKRILCFDNPSEFASPAEMKSVSQIQSEPENRNGSISSRSDTKSRMNIVMETSNLNEEALKSHCDVTISVVSDSSDEVFPCNDNLIVNQVHCQNNEASIVEPSKKLADESLHEALVHEQGFQTNLTVDTKKTICIKLIPNSDPKENSIVEVLSQTCTSKTHGPESNELPTEDTSLNNKKLTSVKKDAIVSHANEFECCESLLDSRVQIASLDVSNSTQENTSSSIQRTLAVTSDSIMPSDSSINVRKSSKGIVLSDSSSQTVFSKEPITNNKNHSSSQCCDVNETLNSKRQEMRKNEKNSRLTAGILSKSSSSTAILEKKFNPRTKPVSKIINKAAIAPNTSKPSRFATSDTKTASKFDAVASLQSPKIVPKELNDTNITVASQIDINSKTVPAKPASSSLKPVTTETNSRSPKNIDPSQTASAHKLKFMRKSFIKPTTPSEEKKTTKMSYSESAIKRNISYVSSLSSRNHQEKLETSIKKPTSRMAERMKLSQKNGSMPSLNKPSSARSLARKTASVEKIPEILKSNTDDDSDGWETVRGRNRCRNSPAKKMPFTKQNQENQAIQFAKINQSRIGGFPYTTKVNVKVVTKNTPKTPDASKKSSILNTKTDKIAKGPKVETGSQNEPSSSKSLKSSALSTLANSTLEVHSNVNDGKTSERYSVDKLLYDNSPDYLNLEYRRRNERSSSAEFLRLPQEVISALETKKFPDAFNSKNIKRSLSSPCLQSELETNFYTLSKTLCISDQYLGIHKYVNVNTFKKKQFDKSVSSTKRRVKKAKALEHNFVEKNALNGNLDESDNGLTSDDQDGQMSHDEAFDVQCQELYDTAWKYKILEQQVHKLELSWGEQMDRFDMELRTPGRALEMHEKLSSPFRKKSLFESIRVCNEKQAKAQEQRERLLVEKAQKFKIIQKKRQEMKTLLEQRQEKQRILMEQKLQRAEEKRKKQLQMIIRKAHDEEEKVNEIAFINSLEAQNKRHDLISKEKDHEARLHDIQEERQRRQEEKAAKEAAAEGRRKILEAERQARLTEMQEKRKIRDHKVEQLFLVKEKERQELASQKARDRELRLSALNAQQQITIEELQKKIQLKQEESARRHEENMEQIRQKAFELSIRKCSSNNDDVPQPVPYERKKICTICNVLIGSEVYLLSHLHGKKHQEAVKVQYQGQDPSAEELELYNLKHIVDASTDQLDPNIALDKERQKALKKRCKKLRQRMSNRGQEYESQTIKAADSLNSSMKANFHRMEKVLSDIKKLSVAVEAGSNDANLLSSLERNLNEIISMYQKKLHQDKAAFKMIGGVNGLISLFGIISNPQLEGNAYVYKKILHHLSSAAESIIENSYELCNFILFSNKIGNLLDFLIQRLNNLIPDNISQLMINQGKSGESSIPMDPTSGRLLRFLTNIFTSLTEKNKITNIDSRNEKENKSSDFHCHVQDLISYIVSIGIVDKLSQFFHCIQGPINNEVEVAAFLLDGIAFVTALIKLSSECFSSTANRKVEDTTQMIATFRVTNMVGAVSLLYALLHSGASSRGEEPPPPLPKQIEILAFSTLCMLNHMAVMSLPTFQSILGSEGLSLQLRHITGHLLWYCSHLTSEALLHEIILLIGYFTVLNPENQSIIQAGQRPTVLQQLCCLPFLYFSDTELTDILFPTLISCCYNNPANKTILQQEMTSELLSNYIEVKYLNGEENDFKVNKNSVRSKRWLFSVRFPKCHWSSAKHDFSAV